MNTISLPTAETIEAIDRELASIPPKYQKHFNSTHEGFAVLKEEVDELWDAVKANESKQRLREEAIQVAAMAIRFIQELTVDE
jgi:NTP pyrophosphatase (non-canonical NTP hydrolase)